MSDKSKEIENSTLEELINKYEIPKNKIGDIEDIKKFLAKEISLEELMGN